MTARSAAQIEFETEATRERVSDLLGELRDRVSPGLVVDEVLGYTGNGAATEFVQTLGQQIKRNPLACAIIGAGVAWLMMSDRRSPLNGADASEGAGSAFDAVGRAADAVGNVASRAVDAVGRAGRATASATAGVGGAASSGYEATKRLGDQVTDTVMSFEEEAVDMARQRGERIINAGSKAGTATWDLLTDQPMVTAGIGFAIGAAAGAMLPSTEAEDELMGEYSDELKGQAQTVAQEQFDKAKSVAERAVDVTKDGMKQMADEALDAVDKGDGSSANANLGAAEDVRRSANEASKSVPL